MRIKMGTMQFNAKPMAELHTKSLIPIRFIASQMKITMSSMHVKTMLFKQQKQALHYPHHHLKQPNIIRCY